MSSRTSLSDPLHTLQMSCAPSLPWVAPPLDVCEVPLPSVPSHAKVPSQQFQMKFEMKSALVLVVVLRSLPSLSHSSARHRPAHTDERRHGHSRRNGYVVSLAAAWSRAHLCHGRKQSSSTATSLPPPPQPKLLIQMLHRQSRALPPSRRSSGEGDSPLVHPPRRSHLSHRLKLLDQLLALWIFLAMAIGILLGQFSNASAVLEKVKFVDVSLPLGTCLPPCGASTTLTSPSITAIALIVMMWPILCRVSPTALLKLFSGREVWYHLLFSVIVKSSPFELALLTTNPRLSGQLDYCPASHAGTGVGFPPRQA
jgi:hypothetical protein